MIVVDASAALEVLLHYEATRVIDAQRGQEAIDDLTAWPFDPLSA